MVGLGKFVIVCFIGFWYFMDRKLVLYSIVFDEIENVLMKMIGMDFDIFVIDDLIGKFRIDLLVC